MEQTFTFSDRNGRQFRATVTIPEDLRNIAFQLAARARHQGRKSVRALDGEITLTLEDVA
jgi:hypothetical protein